MKKHIPVGIIILLFTFINFSTYLVGLGKTPPGMIFTGAVHYPPDYFYYLSFIIQGATRWVTNYHLYSVETTVPELLGWFYTLSGHLLLPIFRSPVIIYQILVIVGSIFYLVVSYLLIRKVLPKHPSRQLLVFILFLTASTWPEITLAHGQWSYKFIYAWYNFGNPFERLTNVPHHLVFEGSAMLAFIIAFDWWRTHSHLWRSGIVLAVIGFVLASMQPALWLLVISVVGSIGFIVPKNRRLSSLLPAVIIAVSGLPFLLYLKLYLYTIPPYNAQLTWEPLLMVASTMRDYVVLNGPLVIATVIGLPLWFRVMTREKFTLTLMTGLSLLLFFSGIPNRLQILNVRFLSVVPTLFMASVTGQFLWHLTDRFPKFRIIMMFLIALFIGHTLLLDAQQLNERNALFLPNNSWYYLSEDAITAYREAAKISGPADAFLVFFPFDASFPGLTGRRIAISYSTTQWTVNFEKKRQLTDVFMNGTMTDEEKVKFLKESRIAYIMNYSFAKKPYSGLIPVYHNNLMTIYKVPAL